MMRYKRINQYNGFTLFEVICTLLIVGVVVVSILYLSKNNIQNEKAKQLSDQTIIYSKIFSDYIIKHKAEIIQEINPQNPIKIIGIRSIPQNILPLGMSDASINVLKQSPCVAIVKSEAFSATNQLLLPILFYVDAAGNQNNQTTSNQIISKKAALILGGKGGYEQNNVVNSIGGWSISTNKEPYLLTYNSELYTCWKADRLGATVTLSTGSVFLNFRMFPYYIGIEDGAGDENLRFWRIKDTNNNYGDYANKNTAKTDIYLFHNEK